MTKLILIISCLASLIFFTNCKKSESTPAAPNIASSVVANLNIISNGFTPDSLSSNSTSAVIQTDPCADTTDFAVCQSNLIREYIRIGKESVDSISSFASQVGSALGEVPDGNSGTSTNGKISWNKTSSEVWSILVRGTSNNSVAYFSVNNGVYTLQIDKTYDEDEPADQQIDATVTYTSADDWNVDIYFGNGVCDATKPADPSKAHIKLSKSSGLWNGKAMLYVPRWQPPGAAAVTCATTAGAVDIAMYTEFVGNDTSTKAALYLIPSTENTAGNIDNDYEVADFCTNFPGDCGGMGELSAGLLTSYVNNWCTTGAGTNPTWNSSCPSNATVAAASYSTSLVWTTPAAIKTQTVTLPTSL